MPLRSFYFPQGGKRSAAYNSRDIAAYIAQQLVQRGIKYDNTKIQKLLYCAYGLSLAKNLGRICDEYPRAWNYGPDFPKVFKYIHNGHDIRNYSDDVQTMRKKGARWPW